MPEYTMEQVAQHKKKSDVWIAIDGKVYDITKFLGEHPGGKGALMSVAGREATEQFMMLHKPSILKKYGDKFQIGTVKGMKSKL